MIAQVAISSVLLLGAGLFLRTLLNAQATDVTADPGNILLANIDLAGQGYDAVRSRAFYPQFLDRMRALPGVRSAALVFVVPMSGRRGGNDIVFEGRRIQVDFNVISSGYFATVGLPVLRGREFTDTDREGTEAAAIINEEMAKRFWPGQDPLGRRIEVVGGKGRIARIVGVVRDGKFRNYRDTLRPCLYVPLDQEMRREMNLEVRAGGDPIRLAPAIREAIRQIDAGLIPPEVLTLKSQRDLGLSQERLIVSLLAGLALLALVLAAVGIYGVVSFTVAQRSREIGIRIALGARGTDVLRLVLRQGLTLVIAGLAIGMGAALALSRLIAGLLFGVRATDAATITATGLVLLVIAAAASYLPARRAAAVDPAIALRQE